jgi:hypothetical protein
MLGLCQVGHSNERDCNGLGTSGEFYFITGKRPFIVMPRTNSNALVYCLTGQVEFYSHPGTLNPDRGLIGDSNEQDCTWLGT